MTGDQLDLTALTATWSAVVGQLVTECAFLKSKNEALQEKLHQAQLDLVEARAVARRAVADKHHPGDKQHHPGK